LGTLVEVNHDDKGIIWPAQVAPFAVHLLEIKSQNSKVKGEESYDKLMKSGVDTLYDDRDVAAGQKFADADLIGIPVRLVVSERNGDKIEWKARTSEKSELLSLEEVINKLK